MRKLIDQVLREAREEIKSLQNVASQDLAQLVSGWDWRADMRMATFSMDAHHVARECVKRVRALYELDVELPARPAPSQKLYASRDDSPVRITTPAEWWTGKPCELCGEGRATNVCHILPAAMGGWLRADNLFVLCPTHHHLFDHSRLSRDEFGRLDTTAKAPDARAYFEKVLRPRQQLFWRYGANKLDRCGRCRSVDFRFIVIDLADGVQVHLECVGCQARFYDFSLVQFHPLAGCSIRVPELVAAGWTEEDARASIAARREQARTWIAGWDGSDVF